jgi:hypothetical protein
MWEIRRLTTLWASTACYRDRFTFYCVELRHRSNPTILKLSFPKLNIRYFPFLVKRSVVSLAAVCSDRSIGVVLQYIAAFEHASVYSTA